MVSVVGLVLYDPRIDFGCHYEFSQIVYFFKPKGVYPVAWHHYSLVSTTLYHTCQHSVQCHFFNCTIGTNIQLMTF